MMIPAVLHTLTALVGYAVAAQHPLLDRTLTCADFVNPDPVVGTVFKKIPNGYASADRSMFVHIPRKSDCPNNKINKQFGLVISYHGAHRTATEQEGLSELSTAKNCDLIAVYPHGIHESWEGPAYHDSSVSDDIQFTLDILKYMSDTYHIDTTRIYATGKSNGGGFVDTLACNPAGRNFAAFSSVSGAFYTEANPEDYPCKVTSGTKVPFLEFHGAADPRMKYTGGDNGESSSGKQGGGPYAAVATVLTNWAIRNGFVPMRDSMHVTNTTYSDPDNTIVYHTSWDCNGNDAVVQGYLITTLQHVWPSTVLNDDNCKDGTQTSPPSVINATDIMLAFFSKYALPAADQDRVVSGEL